MEIGTGKLARLSAEPPRTDRSAEGRSLGQQDFLQIMIAQMRNQNPLEPQSNSEFMAQLAQFSILEQLRTLNESIDAMGSAASFSQASALLGKTVLVSGTGFDNAVTARLEPADNGAIEAISGRPPDGTLAGEWAIRTEADGTVEAVFTPAGGGPTTTKKGKFDQQKTLVDLIPGVTLFAKPLTAGGLDRIVLEPIFAGSVERIVMEKGKPKLLVDGKLVNLTDVLEVTPSGTGGS